MTLTNDHTSEEMNVRTLTIAGRSFRSRLMLGTGKYPSPEVMADCHRESGAEITTVSIRHVNIAPGQQDSILNNLTDNSYFLLPNTLGWLQNGRSSYPHHSPGAGSRVLQLDQARSHRRRANIIS